LDNYLQKLIKKGLLAAVCDQLEDPQTARKEKRKVVKRDISRL
jgi:DNA mismatch repair protein MutS